ncbi:MAG: RDD family protein [Bacteroidales bacterium]|nr:RDD family protein [Bacteroidales bacterium]
MRTIDINTSQKVTISYEIAAFQDRLFAYIIDALIITGAILIFGIIFRSTIFDIQGQMFFIFIALPIFLFYNLLCEIYLNGQTPGKRAMKLRVIKMDGSELSSSDLLIRWIFRSVDIYLSLGSVSAMLISSSNYGQRLGGILSHTVVIRLSPKVEFNLKDILSIYSSEQYNPVYTQVKQLKEKDVLLIKNTIDRYNLYKNDAHKEAVLLLIERVCNLLNIPKPKSANSIVFLKTIVKDYVVLTR